MQNERMEINKMYVKKDSNPANKRANDLGYFLKDKPAELIKIFTHYRIPYDHKATAKYFRLICPICARKHFGDEISLFEANKLAEQKHLDITCQLRYSFHNPNFRVAWRCFANQDHSFEFFNSITGYICAMKNDKRILTILNEIEKIVGINKQDIQLDNKQDTKQNTKQNIKLDTKIITTILNKLTPTQQQMITDANIHLTDEQINGIAIINEVFNEENGMSELDSIIKKENVYKESEEGHEKEGKLYANK